MPENSANQSVPSTNPARPTPFSSNKVTNLSEVAAKFAAHGAGKITAELSSELALDLVLNEIVEQACVATGASGAAVALRRGDDIVCRATCGTNAPELGARLEKGSGLSGACVRTGKIQSCEDAWNDDRANADLSRQLGVRSVVVYPLVGSDGEFLGILEILSPLPSAFVARDLETLEILADRIVKYAEAAREIALAPENSAPVISESAGEIAKRDNHEESVQTPLAPVEADLTSNGGPLREAAVDYVISLERRKHVDWVTAMLSVIILAIALVMGVAFSMRMGWINVNDRNGNDRRGVQRSSVNSTSVVVPGAVAQSAAAGSASSESGIIARPDTKTGSANAKPIDKKKSLAGSGGTLFVYEDGKEIFRMPSSSEQNTTTESRPELISRVEPEYPAQALAQHIQGAVSLHVQVGPDGKVQKINVASGISLLADAAVAAVRQWRFKPYTSNGQPAESEIEITLKFTLPAH